LDRAFCDQNEDIDARYGCYKIIGLDIPKDRTYCELKHPTISSQKYQCLKDNNLATKAEFCEITYFWDVEEKYKCLEGEGVEQNARYC